MKGFFEKLQNKQKAAAAAANRGGGKALGGNKAGIVLPITLSSPGPLGVLLENTSEGSAIVAKVTQGSAAEMAGLKRGDIFCFSGTQGKEEIPYRMFLDMIRGSVRPIEVDVRRIDTSATSSSSSSSSVRADAEARRQAVIAAAEARDKQHKESKKPIRKTGVESLTKEQREKIQMQRNKLAEINAETMTKEPLSEEAKKAVQNAKINEAVHAAELGYNPYETMRGTGKQASSAVTTLHHGALKSHPSSGSGDGNGNGNGNGRVKEQINRNRPNTTTEDDNLQHDNHDTKNNYWIMESSIDPAFDEAFAVLVSVSNHDDDKTQRTMVKKSLRVMRKLIQNATMEGQTQDKKRVRLSNPNPHIEAAIHNVNGALDLMMSVGFVILEEEEESKAVVPEVGSLLAPESEQQPQQQQQQPAATAAAETFLVYNPSGHPKPLWLSKALKQMEDYENQL